MKVVETAKIKKGSLPESEMLQVYNGLDCMLTQEIFDEVSGPNNSNISPAAQLVYDFERAMQGPALDMMLRGWKVDLFKRDMGVASLKRKKQQVQEILDELVCVLWEGGRTPLDPKRKTPGLNAGSYLQKQRFLYGRLGLPEQYRYDKGVRKLTTNREALEKLEDYFHARPFIRCILKLQDLQKKIGVLSSEVSHDGRMHTSYGVASTESGRWNSTKSVFDEGTNLQNITEELRDIFVADKGKKLAYVDKSQAEARVVGWLCFILFGDSVYLDACEGGDLHTNTAKLIWPNLPWTGNPDEDKAIAERKFYLHFSYRDLSKRGGHATNYYGTARTVARHLKVREEIIRAFQTAYFAAFPGISEYHRYVAREIGLHQYLETPLGMGRHFFGRPDDDATLREGIAFIPQSVVAQLLNLALWRIWKHLPEVECLGQIHDAVVVQYDEEREDEIIPKILKLMPTPLEHAGRIFTIPSDVMVGWNWRKWGDGQVGKDGKKTHLNLDGLKSYKGHDDRKRTTDPESNGLDRVISQVY